MFPRLFSPLTIGPVELKNHIVFTGHATNLTDDGYPNDRLFAYQQARARDGPGLIVTEVSSVHPRGWPPRSPLRAFSDECIAHYAPVPEAVLEGMLAGERV